MNILNRNVLNCFNFTSKSQLTACLFVSLFFVSLSFFLISDAYAFQKNRVNEQLKVKAAFVLNLARFIEWPEETTGEEKEDVVLCFYQYNFLKESINSILDKKINNKPIKIKVIKELKLKGRCDVVLIPESTISLFVNYNDFDDLQKKITITDLSHGDIGYNSKQSHDHFLENKIIFRLTREKSRLRFEVNKTASERLGIVIGSELLKLGILVKDQDGHSKRIYP